MMEIPKYLLFPFIIIFFLIPPLHNGETILTDGTEKANEGIVVVHIMNGTQKPELFFTQTVPIKHYSSQDQCYLQPGNQEILPMALVFFLPLEALNAGTGIIFCYKGQLDKKGNIERGLGPVKQFLVNNVANNEVVKICGPNMHGFQLKEADNGRKLVITLSTTNIPFVIDRSKFPHGILVLKLTHWKSLVSHLATKIGTNKWNRHLVNIPMDRALRNAFFQNVHLGATLQKFVGLWSLGVDILPASEYFTADDQFEIFVNRSICSEIAAMFKLASDPVDSDFSGPKKFEPLGSNVTSNKTLEIPNGSDMIVRGKVGFNPDNFLFQIRTTGIGGMLAFRLNFSFKDKTITMEKFDGKWKQVGKSAENKLIGGQQFRMKAIYENFELKVSINCGQFETFSFEMTAEEMGKLMADGVGFNFGFFGDVEIYWVEFRDEKLEGWVHGQMLSKEIKINAVNKGDAIYKGGILIRAYILPDPEWNITIELESEKEEKFIFSTDSKNEDISFQPKLKNDVKKSYYEIKAGTEFEIHFLVKKYSIDIIIMGNYNAPFLTWPYNGENPKKNISVKINASFDQGSFFYYKTISTPIKFTLIDGNYFEKGSMLTLYGKIPKNAKKFSIDFLDYDVKIPKLNECQTKSDVVCKIPLHIHCNLKEDTAEFSQLEIDSTSGDMIKEWVNKLAFDPNPFHGGMEFEMNITSNPKEFNIVLQELNVDKFRNYSYPSTYFRIKTTEVYDDIFMLSWPKLRPATEG